MMFDSYHMMGDPSGFFHSIHAASAGPPTEDDDVVFVQMLNSFCSSSSQKNTPEPITDRNHGPPSTAEHNPSLSSPLIFSPFEALMSTFKEEEHSPSSYDLLMSFSYPGSCPSFFVTDDETSGIPTKTNLAPQPPQWNTTSNTSSSLEPSIPYNDEYSSFRSSSNSTLYDCSPAEVARLHHRHLLRNTPWPGRYNTVAMTPKALHSVAMTPHNDATEPMEMWNSADYGSDNVFCSEDEIESKQRTTVVKKIKSLVKKLKK